MDVLENYNVEMNLRSLTYDDQWKPVSFKEDGARFQTSKSTIKLCCDLKYVIDIRVEPKITFEWWWVDVHEHKSKSNTSPIVASYSPSFLKKSTDENYQYTAIWHAKDLDPTPNGNRSVVNFFIQGSKLSISKPIQCKFYAKDDWHADYGHACGGITFQCSALSDGDICVKDERFKFAKGYAQRRHGLARCNTI